MLLWASTSTTPLCCGWPQVAAAGSTEALRSNAVDALIRLHTVSIQKPDCERHDFPALRPCIPQLLLLLRSPDVLMQQAAAGFLWDMTASDDCVPGLLATPDCLTVLTNLLKSNDQWLLQAAACMLRNLLNIHNPCGGGATQQAVCRAMLATPQLIQAMVHLVGTDVDPYFANEVVDRFPQTKAASCLHKLLQLDLAEARRVVSAAQQAHRGRKGGRGKPVLGGLQAGAVSRYGPLKQECKDILALL